MASKRTLATVVWWAIAINYIIEVGYMTMILCGGQLWTIASTKHKDSFNLYLGMIESSSLFQRHLFGSLQFSLSPSGADVRRAIHLLMDMLLEL